MATSIVAEKSASTAPQGADRRTIQDLNGELGERGRIAWRAALEAAQSAGAVRDIIDSDCEPAERNLVVDHLLRRIEALGYLGMSCMDGDDTMDNLCERLGRDREGVQHG